MQKITFLLIVSLLAVSNIASAANKNEVAPSASGGKNRQMGR